MMGHQNIFLSHELGAERASEARSAEQTAERAVPTSRRASSPLLTSRFMVVLNHNAILGEASGTVMAQKNMFSRQLPYFIFYFFFLFFLLFLSFFFFL